MCPEQTLPSFSDCSKSSHLAFIKPFVQKICTPITAAKRLKYITNFFRRFSSISFDHSDYLYICKGLFYAVWYSEMNKGCDEIIDSIALNCGSDEKLALAMFEALAIEWIGIDTYRVDKFLYLVRKIVQQILIKQRLSFKEEKPFNGHLMEDIISQVEKFYGLLAHLIYVLSQELVNVLKEEDNRNHFKVFIFKQILPFLNLMTRSDDSRLLDSIKSHLVFDLFVSLTKSDCIKNPARFRGQLSEFLRAFCDLPSLSRKQKAAFNSSISLLHSHQELSLVLQEEAIVSRFAKRKASNHIVSGRKKKRRV